MRYSEALDLMREGAAVRRAHWPPEKIVFLVPGSEFQVAADRPMGKALPHLVGRMVRYAEHVDTALGNRVGVWQHTLTDVNADDWEVWAGSVIPPLKES